MTNQQKRRWIYLIAYFAYTSIYIARVNLTMANPNLVSMSEIGRAV